MSEEKPQEEHLTEEFRNLGRNLAAAIRAAWDSPERKRFQQEIEAGLKELGTTLQEEMDTFDQSETKQRLKSDLESASERIRSGEVTKKVHDGLLEALRTANEELKKASQQWEAKQPGKGQGEGGEGL